jgi:hypothetical protein
MPRQISRKATANADARHFPAVNLLRGVGADHDARLELQPARASDAGGRGASAK